MNLARNPAVLATSLGVLSVGALLLLLGLGTKAESAFRCMRPVAWTRDDIRLAYRCGWWRCDFRYRLHRRDDSAINCRSGGIRRSWPRRRRSAFGFGLRRWTLWLRPVQVQSAARNVHRPRRGRASSSTRSRSQVEIQVPARCEIWLASGRALTIDVIPNSFHDEDPEAWMIDGWSVELRLSGLSEPPRLSPG